MAGVRLDEAYVGLDGIWGDRQYAFVLANDAGTKSFPWMTARQDPRMLAYRPVFDQLPTSNKCDPMVHVCTPNGRILAVSDCSLLEEIQAKSGRKLFLLRSARGLFDCQHVSAFSLATVGALAEEASCEIDHRQFRANLYIEPACGRAFVEEQWTESMWAVGSEVLLSVAQRDSRCMMVNFHPETGTITPGILGAIARLHGNQAGLYLNVVRAGKIREGDEIRRIPITF